MTNAEDSQKRILWRQFVGLCNRLQVTYYLIRFGEALTFLLPLRLCYLIANGIGDGIYLSWRVLRRQVAANVRQVLGENSDARDVALVTRQVFRNYLKYLVDFVVLPSLRKEELERLVRISGLEHLERALETGKGVIFVGLHFGSFELAAGMMALRGYRMNVVVETFQPQKLDELIQRRRAEKGMTLIPLEATTATRRLFRALHKNEILGLLIDRPSKNEGVAVRFCGGVTRVPGGAATLALKTGAKLLCGYVVRQKDNTFVGNILPHIDAETTGNWQEDVQRVTQRVMTVLEGSVRQHPEQWFMFRDMWPRELLEEPVTLAAEVPC